MPSSLGMGDQIQESGHGRRLKEQELETCHERKTGTKVANERTDMLKDAKERKAFLEKIQCSLHQISMMPGIVVPKGLCRASHSIAML